MSRLTKEDLAALPKIIPITRRVPPKGYRKPIYGEPNREDLASLGGVDHDLCEEEDGKRLAEAKRVAARAITGWRWWHLSALLTWLRFWLQGWRR